jgi:hypothetical protein
MRNILLPLALMISTASFSQMKVGVFAGIANYQGDLIDKPFQAPKFAGGVSLAYEFSERLALRAGLTFAKLGGADSLSDKDYLRARNLSFQTALTEFSLRGEYTIFNMSNIRWSPYVFGGLAVFHYNPYTIYNGNKVLLKPLSTEGQGLSTYPDRKPYSLTQVALPFGGGVKYAISDKVDVGLELGMRKLFTDYLDDVSTNYADANDLLAERSPLSVELAYRGDEVPGGNPIYPAKGEQRGGVEQKDWYYFTGLNVNIRLGDLSSAAFGGSGKRSKNGCPSVF